MCCFYVVGNFYIVMNIIMYTRHSNECRVFVSYKPDLMVHKLPQRDRNYLQKCLKENGAISTKLFPDFEGVKKNIEFSEDYNILRDWEIAYQEASFHSKFISKEDLLKMANGDQNVIDSRLNTDQLKEGEFFLFR